MWFYLALILQLIVLSGLTWAIYWIMGLDIGKIRTQVIDVMANFMVDLLEHPRLKLALAQVVTNGMNHTIEQPDLGERLAHVGDSLREDNLKMSRSMGEQLPGLAANFVGGAIDSLKMTSSKKNKNSKGKEEVLHLELDGSVESKKNT